MMKVFYFAYGSNMNSQRLEERVGRYFSRYPGTLHGWKLTFDKPNAFGRSYANIKRDDKSVVEGIVYELTPNQIKKMDFFEGAPEHYERKLMTVEIAGQRFLATVYVANNRKDNILPELGYLRHLFAGQRFLSRQYLQTILNVAEEVKEYERKKVINFDRNRMYIYG
jgi:gamma-glutamylcyclotransferase